MIFLDSKQFREMFDNKENSVQYGILLNLFNSIKKQQKLIKNNEKSELSFHDVVVFYSLFLQNEDNFMNLLDETQREFYILKKEDILQNKNKVIFLNNMLHQAQYFLNPKNIPNTKSQQFIQEQHHYQYLFKRLGNIHYENKTLKENKLTRNIEKIHSLSKEEQKQYLQFISQYITQSYKNEGTTFFNTGKEFLHYLLLINNVVSENISYESCDDFYFESITRLFPNLRKSCFWHDVDVKDFVFDYVSKNPNVVFCDDVLFHLFEAYTYTKNTNKEDCEIFLNVLLQHSENNGIAIKSYTQPLGNRNLFVRWESENEKIKSMTFRRNNTRDILESDKFLNAINFIDEDDFIDIVKNKIVNKKISISIYKLMQEKLCETLFLDIKNKTFIKNKKWLDEEFKFN